MKSRLLLDVIIGQGAAVFQLLSSKDQALLVRRSSMKVKLVNSITMSGHQPLFVLNLGLRRLNLKCVRATW
jgi:hypothetical protein